MWIAPVGSDLLLKRDARGEFTSLTYELFMASHEVNLEQRVGQSQEYEFTRMIARNDTPWPLGIRQRYHPNLSCHCHFTTPRSFFPCQTVTGSQLYPRQFGKPHPMPALLTISYATKLKTWQHFGNIRTATGQDGGGQQIQNVVRWSDQRGLAQIGTDRMGRVLSVFDTAASTIPPPGRVYILVAPLGEFKSYLLASSCP